MEMLQINSNIIHDNIEGEVILLNVDTGTYYQLKDEAVSVWEDIAGGAPVPVLAANLTARYGISPDQALESIQPFLRDLQTEEIVTLAPASGTSAAPPPEPVALGRAFKPPVLLKYTDMQSLLLLDPIHDVDTPGWPQQQAHLPG